MGDAVSMRWAQCERSVSKWKGEAVDELPSVGAPGGSRLNDAAMDNKMGVELMKKKHC